MKKIIIVSIFVVLMIVSAGFVSAASQSKEQKSEQSKEQKSAMEQLTFHWRTHEQDKVRMKDQIQQQSQNQN